jgi:predicted RNA binding protein YcfA (HicA-like mRNA interferase family)
MKSVSGADFAKLLEKHGWKLLRVNGSHHIYRKAGHIERISVPIHGNQSLNWLVASFAQSCGVKGI